MKPSNNNNVPSDETRASVVLAQITAPLDPASALSVRTAFSAMFDRVESWQAEAAGLVVQDESETRKMQRARTLRLEIKEARVSLDKKRRDLKAGILVEGRAIDGAYAVFESLSSPLEKLLLEQEQFALRAEEGRRDALRDARQVALSALGVSDAAMPGALGEITHDAWTAILEDAQAAQRARAEAVRIADEARKEAERLSAEREAARRAEALRIEVERLARETDQRAENDRLRAEAKKVADAELAAAWAAKTAPVVVAHVRGHYAPLIAALRDIAGAHQGTSPSWFIERARTALAATAEETDDVPATDRWTDFLENA